VFAADDVVLDCGIVASWSQQGENIPECDVNPANSGETQKELALAILVLNESHRGLRLSEMMRGGIGSVSRHQHESWNFPRCQSLLTVEVTVEN